MSKNFLILLTIGLAIGSITACSVAGSSPTTQPSIPLATSPPPPNSQPNLSKLFDKAWRVTTAPTPPARGSIYVFLSNGILLETSCVETYRLATWTIAKTDPKTLRVVEDGRLVYTAKIAKLTDANLQLDRTLIPTKKTDSIGMTAIDREFTCPDLPKK
jgi:hypothetical protein